MRKILVVALLSALSLPSLALSGMTVMDEDGMAEVRGQVGITIDLDAYTNTGYMCYGDSDGIVGTANAGYFTFGDLTISNGVSTSNALLNGMTMDLGTLAGITYWVVGLPDLTGRILFRNVRLGTSTNTGAAIGNLELGNIDFTAGSILKIFPNAQVGVNLALDAGTASGAPTGYLCYGDSNGMPGSTVPGYFTFGGLTIDNGATTGTRAQLGKLTLDLGTTTANTMMVVGLPNLTGRIFFSQVRLGTSTNAGAIIGNLELGNVTFSSSSVLQIYGH